MPKDPPHTGRPVDTQKESDSSNKHGDALNAILQDVLKTRDARHVPLPMPSKIVWPW